MNGTKWALTPTLLRRYADFLREQEKADNTVAKYLRDLRALAEYLDGRPAGRAELLEWKRVLTERYAPASVNSMLTAANGLLGYLGAGWRLKYLKVQRKTFLPADRELREEEYRRMVRAARKRGDRRLGLLVQTLCALGIRVSELRAVTVESLEAGEALIRNKGRLRTILIPEELAAKLRGYCRAGGIRSGPVFVTRTGRPLDRSNIWKMVKRLARLAHVQEKKAYPHNLRHLFARKYYERFKDVVRLADILGHSSVDTTRIYTAGSGQKERRQLGMLRLAWD